MADHAPPAQAAVGATRPFARFEWLIAWRYLRARRAEGGVSVMTWISVVGITLAVFALIATMAVRAGFRAEFVSTILGANAHVTIYSAGETDEYGRVIKGFTDYDARAAALAAVPGVTRATPIIRGQVMITANGRNSGVEIHGMAPGVLAEVPSLTQGDDDYGDLTRLGTPASNGVASDVSTFNNASRLGVGIALGQGIARDLGLTVGDRVRLISPDGPRTPMGPSLRTMGYEVVYIFNTGSPEIDRTRAYMSFDEAQGFFNREGRADEIEVMVADPAQIDRYRLPLLQAAGEGAIVWTWQDSAGNYLRALTVEDNMMFILMSILVLIAAMNIISGLVMLVRNKGRDIGILRTMGLSEGSVLRIFFLCGAVTGLAGTVMGIVLGCLFALYFTPIFDLVNMIVGGGVWDPTVRPIYHLSAQLRLADVASAAALSLVLSFVVTIFPARRAARMNPVEALRYE